jgi:hypothetical protein
VFNDRGVVVGEPRAELRHGEPVEAEVGTAARFDRCPKQRWRRRRRRSGAEKSLQAAALAGRFVAMV